MSSSDMHIDVSQEFINFKQKIYIQLHQKSKFFFSPPKKKKVQNFRTKDKLR